MCMDRFSPFHRRAIFGAGGLVLCFKVLGPFALIQAALIGLIGGLIQARFAELKVTVTQEPKTTEQGDLDSLFELIQWNERTLSWIVGGMVVV